MSAGAITVEMTMDPEKYMRALGRVEEADVRRAARLRELKERYSDTFTAAVKGEEELIKKTGDAAKVQWEYEQRIKSTKDAWKAQRDEAEGALTGAAKWSADAIKGIGAMAAAYASVQGAISLVNAELQNQIDLHAKVKAFMIDLSSSESDVIRNLGDMATPEAIDAVKEGRKIAREYGASLPAIQRGIGQGLSASAINVPLTLGAAKIAAQMVPDQPDAIPLIMGAIVDMWKVTGLQDAPANMGALSMIGSLSRLVDPKKQAEHIPGALVGQMQFGADFPTAASLYSVLSSLAADVQGRRTATGVINLAKQLRDFYPVAGSEAEYTMGGSLTGAEEGQRERNLRSRAYRRGTEKMAQGELPNSQELIALKREENFAKKLAGKLKKPALPPLATEMERIEYGWEHPEVAKMFMESTSYQARVEGPIESLILEPQGLFARELRRQMELFGGITGQGYWSPQALADPARGVDLSGYGPRMTPTMAKMVGVNVQMLKNLAALPSNQVAKLARGFQATKEALYADSPELAVAGILREGMADLRQIVGESSLRQRITQFNQDFDNLGMGAAGAPERFREELQGMLGEVRNPVRLTMPGYSAGYGFADPIQTPRAPTAHEQLAASLIEDMIKRLDEMIRLQRENNAKNRGPVLAPNENK